MGKKVTIALNVRVGVVIYLSCDQTRKRSLCTTHSRSARPGSVLGQWTSSCRLQRLTFDLLQAGRRACQTGRALRVWGRTLGEVGGPRALHATPKSVEPGSILTMKCDVYSEELGIDSPDHWQSDVSDDVTAVLGVFVFGVNKWSRGVNMVSLIYKQDRWEINKHRCLIFM